MVYYQDNRIVIHHDDVLTTQAIENNSIDLIVTSPPYNVDINYGVYSDGGDYVHYLDFYRKWMKRCLGFLKDDGRICLNIPLDKNKGGIQSIFSDVVALAKDVGFKYRTTILWNEGNISRRTAWGSWLSASSPHVIAPVEMIVVMYKKHWKKMRKDGISDITKDEFIAWTNGLWTFPGESKKRIGHPAPFPLELPKRCIKLFSFVDDVIFDPFMGSGTTLVAASMLNRRGIGMDIEMNYCKLAAARQTQPRVTR